MLEISKLMIEIAMKLLAVQTENSIVSAGQPQSYFKLFFIIDATPELTF